MFDIGQTTGPKQVVTGPEGQCRNKQHPEVTCLSGAKGVADKKL